MENDIIDLLEQIRTTSSSNEKIRLIQKNAGNELFRRALVFLLDSRITTGLSKAKINKAVTIVPSRRIITFSAMIDYLEQNNTGTDQNIANVQSFIQEQPEETREWYKEFFTKRYKIGVTVKSANKAIPNLIWEHNVQQAYPISDKNRPKDGERFCLSQKINGTNCSWNGHNMLSRQGKPFSNLDHIIREINTLGLGDMFVNGELVRDNYDDIPDDENFQKSVSIINSDAKDKTEICFIIYEVLTLREFYAGKSDKMFKDRVTNMIEIGDKIAQLDCKYIRVVPYFYLGADQSKIQEWLDFADANGMEGLMLNKCDAYWLNKRNNGILKVKSFHSADLRCLRLEEGDGKLKGTLGKVVCDYKGYELGVGSGFTLDQRDKYWNNPDEIVGKIVEVKYKTETKNKDGGVSVQFPVFQGVRQDKDEVSYN